MKANILKESITESQYRDSDVNHYGVKLEEIIELADEISTKLQGDSIPAWVGDMITLAKNNLDEVKSWIRGLDQESDLDINIDVVTGVDDDDVFMEPMEPTSPFTDDDNIIDDAPDVSSSEVMIDPEDELDGDDVLLEEAEYENRLVDMYREISTYFPLDGIDPELERKAEASGITDQNNRELKNLTRGWMNGLYDEDPGALMYEIKNLINNSNH